MSMVSRAKSVPIVTAFAVAATLSLVGCGSDESAPERNATATSTSAAPTGERKAASITVDVDDMKFSPENVTVGVGDTVRWKFSDKAPHSVQGIGDKAMGINSPIFDNGEWSYTFTQPGTYRYLCTLHPEMRGTVTVQ
ncbi:cupredoxin domain-containing protein [Nocardia amikacinitolerans]|uniref:cupredoxin domain-containing protein n=1 Tax=Nocardia amikacinitolerans TaxID=756689 RepID=UPI0020A56F18|nr:cupredoxin family copper-binding protein [Nocardia amikacinitolerans]